MPTILAADVGGTKTLVALFDCRGTRLRVVREAAFASREHASFESLVAEFLGRGRRRVRAAAVGVAGPVVAGRTEVVNLRWPVDERRLGEALETPHVRVINDLEATAWGIAELSPRRLANLTPGVAAGDGHAALIAAGTGLGMSVLFRRGEEFVPLPSEGGHQHFAPRDDLEIDLLRFLRRRHGRVSIERVVAGPGMLAIYQFLTETGRGKESRAMARRLAVAADPNAVITEAGVAGTDALAQRVVELFVSMYGAAAGDLALVAKATGGVYVGGGIAPRLLPRLRAGGFMRAFRDKGRLSSLLERIPVRVILEPRAALLGAAACAARLDRGR